MKCSKILFLDCWYSFHDPCTAVVCVFGAPAAFFYCVGSPLAMHAWCGAYAVTMFTIARGRASRMGLELEEELDELYAAVAAKWQEQRL